MNSPWDGAGTLNQDGRPIGISAPTCIASTSEVSDFGTAVKFQTLVCFTFGRTRSLSIPCPFLGIGSPPPPVEPSPREIRYERSVSDAFSGDAESNTGNFVSKEDRSACRD